MPHPGHFCGGSRCRFHLNTYVNGYIVSTVGEYVPFRDWKSLGLELKDIKTKGEFEEIGVDRLYETMVFKAEKSDHGCCPWDANVSDEIDFEGYNESSDAYKGHIAMCEKWDVK